MHSPLVCLVELLEFFSQGRRRSWRALLEEEQNGVGQLVHLLLLASEGFCFRLQLLKHQIESNDARTKQIYINIPRCFWLWGLHGPCFWQRCQYVWPSLRYRWWGFRNFATCLRTFPKLGPVVSGCPVSIRDHRQAWTTLPTPLRFGSGCSCGCVRRPVSVSLWHVLAANRARTVGSDKE